MLLLRKYATRIFKVASFQSLPSLKMQRSRKRQRTVPVVVESRVRRPIDKQLINVNITGQGTTQANVSLITATFPATITGVRWSIRIQSLTGGAANSGGWAIVRVKDGLAPNNMSFTNAATFLEPEQEVLAFGRWAVQDADIATNCGPSIDHIDGSTKSMRKLMGGDQIYFCVNGINAGITSVLGIIQFFSKT